MTRFGKKAIKLKIRENTFRLPFVFYMKQGNDTGSGDGGKGRGMVSRLYQLFYWELLRYMKNRTESMAEAEDIVQETFLRALEHGELIDTMGEAQCRAWLYRTAKNLHIDRIRRAKAEPVLDEGESWEDDLSRAEVAQLCECLEEKERAMFQMRYFEGYNASEIGALFQMPPATVRARLLAARKKLQESYPELKKERRNVK